MKSAKIKKVASVGLSDVGTLLNRMKKLRLLVVGDVMLDRFIYGAVSRISPEAPVPIVHVQRETAYPGGAANVGRNITDFGSKCEMLGLVGRDSGGHELLSLMKQSGLGVNLVQTIQQFSTIQKTRIIARQQQVVRVDREQPFNWNGRDYDKFAKRLAARIARVDAVIIEDYGKGFITQKLADLIARLCKRYKKILTVDPNTNNPLHWEGATTVKPNRAEAVSILKGKLHPRQANSLTVDQIGAALLDLWDVPTVLLTLGEGGMQLFQQGHKSYHTPTKAREVFDVSGAGDTAIAFFTLALAAGAEPATAAEIANHAAGIVVGKLGTATLSFAELKKSLENHANA